MVFSIFYKKGPRQRSVLNRHRSRANPEDLCIKRYHTPLRPRRGAGRVGQTSRSDPSIGVKEVVNMLMHTGRSGAFAPPTRGLAEWLPRVCSN